MSDQSTEYEVRAEQQAGRETWTASYTLPDGEAASMRGFVTEQAALRGGELAAAEAHARAGE